MKKKVVGLIGLLILVAIVLTIYSCRKNVLKVDYYGGKSQIEIGNTYPITRTLGKELSIGDSLGSVVEFEVVSGDNNHGLSQYEICLEDVSRGSRIDAKYVNVYLTDAKTDKPLFDSVDGVVSFNKLRIAKSNINYRGLYKDSMMPNHKKKYRLRVWLDDNYKITDDLEYFQIKIKVKGIK